MKHRFVWMAALALAVGAFPAATAGPAAQTVDRGGLVGVRLLKAVDAGTLDWSVDLPAACAGCKLLRTPETSAQNAREIYFHIAVPSGSVALDGMHVRIAPDKLRGLVIGKTHVAFSRTADGIRFDVPHPLPLKPVGDLTTVLTQPGLTMVIHHNDPLRKRGAYADRRFPARQDKAALNLEFAAREAVERLGLMPKVLAAKATFLIQNFDTSYPTTSATTAHIDAPPHWHIQIVNGRADAHLYIGDDGLLTMNFISVAVPKPWTPGGLLLGTPSPYLTPDGTLLATDMVQLDGHYAFSADGQTCRFEPVGEGYDNGVDLDCGDGKPVRVIVTDALETGALRIGLNDRETIYRYDPDTGALLSSEGHK